MKYLPKMIIVALLFTACNTVTPSKGTFDITLSNSSLTVTPNSHSSITVNVSRLDGFAGDISVGLDGNPSGFNAAPITIPATAASGTFDLETTATPGSSTSVNLRASGSGAANVTRTVNVTVQPFTTTLLDSSFIIAPGGSLTTKILIGRLGGFNDAVTVSLGGLPNGVTSNSVTIPAGETSATLKISAANSALETISSANLSVTTSSGTYSQSTNVRLDVQLLPGAFDPSFGLNGVIRGDNFPSNVGINSWLIQNDGKYVLAGLSGAKNVTLTRWNADATLDSSFGLYGVVTFPTSLANSYSAFVHQAGNGGFLVTASESSSGTLPGKLQLWLIGANGAINTNFGTNGTVTLADSTNNKGFGDAVVLPNGQIMVVGESGSNGSVITSQPLFRRLQANGSIDSSFGSGGDVLLGGVGTLRQNLTGAMITSDGSILGYGFANNTCVLGRIDPRGAGAPTSGFGGAGVKWFSTNELKMNGCKILESNGSLLLIATGTLFSTGNNGTVIKRLKTDGSLDPNYAISSSAASAVEGLTGADGSLVLLGMSQNYYQGDAILERYTPSGVLDSTFGNSGKVLIPRQGTETITLMLTGTFTANRLTVFGAAQSPGTSNTLRGLSARIKY